MPESRRHPNVANIDKITPNEEVHGGLAFRRRRLGVDIGGRALGCSHFEVAPGKTAFPFHFHSAVEEAIYVLEGTATLRMGKERVELRAGDYSEPGTTFHPAWTAMGPSYATLQRPEGTLHVSRPPSRDSGGHDRARRRTTHVPRPTRRVSGSTTHVSG